MEVQKGMKKHHFLPPCYSTTSREAEAMLTLRADVSLPLTKQCPQRQLLLQLPGHAKKKRMQSDFHRFSERLRHLPPVNQHQQTLVLSAKSRLCSSALVRALQTRARRRKEGRPTTANSSQLLPSAEPVTLRKLQPPQGMLLREEIYLTTLFQQHLHSDY